MLFYPTEKLALLVDGPNIYGVAKALQFDVDYKKLLEHFAKRGTLIRASYYTAISADDDEFSPLRPLVDYLEYNGWRMVTKVAREFTDSQGRRRVKSCMDVDLAVDALEIAASVDHLVIFSGNGDFCPLVGSLQRLGKRVTICSTIKSTPPMCADELRRMADNFCEIDDLKSHFTRTPKGHPDAA